jgi:hypothetical protein
MEQSDSNDKEHQGLTDSTNGDGPLDLTGPMKNGPGN